MTADDRHPDAAPTARAPSVQRSTRRRLLRQLGAAGAALGPLALVAAIQGEPARWSAALGTATEDLIRATVP